MKLKTNKTFTKGLKKKKPSSEFEIRTTKRIKLSFYRDEREKKKSHWQQTTNPTPIRGTLKERGRKRLPHVSVGYAC